MQNLFFLFYPAIIKFKAKTFLVIFNKNFRRLIMATINDIAAKLGISKSTVSKGLNNASDVSEETRKKILETAVELGYINKRQQKKSKKLCILVENMEFDTPNHFGHDIVLGFKQMAEPEGWEVDIIPITIDFQKLTPYDIFMMQGGYQASFILGLSLFDPLIQ